MNVGRKLMLIVIASVALVTIPSAGAIYYYAKHKVLAGEAATLVAETKILAVPHTQKLADAGTSLQALSRILKKNFPCLLKLLMRMNLPSWYSRTKI